MPLKRNAKKNASRTKAKPNRTRARSAKTKQIKQGDGQVCPIVGIGGSAGGFEAAMELLKALPPKNNMAFVVVQHLDPHHASRLPNLLGRATQMPVVEISGRMKPEPNKVYVLPPNKGL